MTVTEMSTPVDRVEADVIALSFFENERPLRGSAGFADWRMNGAISRLLVKGMLNGREGETFLTTTDGRLQAPRLLLFGLGDSGLFNAGRFQFLMQSFVSAVSRLNLKRAAVGVPGSSLFKLDGAVEAIKKEFERHSSAGEREIIIIG